MSSSWSTTQSAQDIQTISAIKALLHELNVDPLTGRDPFMQMIAVSLFYWLHEKLTSDEASKLRCPDCPRGQSAPP